MKKFFLTILLVVMLLSLRGLALAERPDAPAFTSHDNKETVYINKLNSSLKIKWTKVSGATKYNVAVKLLDGEPNPSNNEKGVSLVNKQTSNNYVLISRSKLQSGKWLKVAVSAVNRDGSSSWPSMYLYLSSSGSSSSSQKTTTTKTTTTSLHSAQARSSASSYVDKTINKTIQSGSALKALQNGKSVVFMFEGAGTSLSTSKRSGALCVIVQMKNGKPFIAYECSNCSTVPDYPKKPAYNEGTDMPIVVDGIYSITSCNHQGKYASVHIKNGVKVVRFNESNAKNGYSSTSNAINMHRRSSSGVGFNWADKSKGVNGKGANSTGCFLIGSWDSGKQYTEYTKFLKTLGVIGSGSWNQKISKTGTSLGVVVVDRTQAKEYLTDLYGSSGARKIMGQ